MRRVLDGSVSVVSGLMISALLVASMPSKIDLIGEAEEVWAMDSAPHTARTDAASSASDLRIAGSLEGDPEAIALGKRTFHTYCWGCHGRNGTGERCPDFTDNKQIHGDGYEDLVRVVTNGVKGTPMGPWGYALGRQRLLQVVAYVYSLKGTREARRK